MGELAADYAHLEGVALPMLAADTLDALKDILPPMATPANPLDLTGAVVNNPDLFRQCMEAMAQDPAIAVLVCLFDVPTALNGDWAPFAVGSMEAIGRYRPQGGTRHLVVSNTLKYVSDRSRELVAEVKLPYLPCGLDLSLRALRNAITWSTKYRGAQQAGSAPTGPVMPAMPARLPVSEFETLAYLKGFGVPVVPQVLARTQGEAVAAANALNCNVVLKIASPDIAHKTEAGGVLLNLAGAAAVVAGFQQIFLSAKDAAPQARLDGVLVAPMRGNGVELFVGVRLDPQWGHVIALGLGGVWIEALKDVSLRLLPVRPADVAEMLGELRGVKLLAGYRGAQAVNIAQVAQAVARIGDAALSLGATLDTLEVNPLLASGGAVEALDALATYKLS
jgi:acyl-CoA synthetase (NDP forming)